LALFVENSNWYRWKFKYFGLDFMTAVHTHAKYPQAIFFQIGRRAISKNYSKKRLFLDKL